MKPAQTERTRFSGRFPASLEPSPFALRLAARRASGAAFLDLTEANPTRAGLGYLDVGIEQALVNAAALEYEPDPRGLLAAREAVSEYYAGRGSAVPPANVVLVASTSEAYSHLFRLLGDPGDVFHVPRPSYPLFEPLAAFEAVRLAPYRLRYRGDAWRLDVEALQSAIGPRSRAVVVVTPNHPTGSCFDPVEAERVVELCAQHNMALIADEVFADFARTSGRALRVSYAGEERALTFALSGLSKVAGLPQMKAAWIAASGPLETAGPALERLEWIADTFLSVSGPVQKALPDLLAGRMVFQAKARARVESNRERLTAWAAGVPSTAILESDGGWNAILQLAGNRDDEDWALGLLDRGVVVHPGYFYDFEEPGHLVVSLLPEPEVFDEALEHLRELTSC